MRILVLQSGRFDHFLSATQAVVARYPSAHLVGLVRKSDLQCARAAGQFVEVHLLPSDVDLLSSPVSWSPRPDRCVVPFEDRLGVRYWTFRRIPIWHRIPIVISYNKQGKVQEWGRTTWILNTLFACVGARAIYSLKERAQVYLFHLIRALDVAGVFSLAGIALILRGLKALGLYQYRRNLAQRYLTGPQRVVLFIPSLGMGGAQRQLASFLKQIDRDRWEPEVVTLETLDKFFDPVFRELDIPITYLYPNPMFWDFSVVWRLIRYLHAKPCYALHSWLHYAAALGAIAGNLTGIPIIIGSLRSERPSRFPWFYPKWQRGIDVLTAPLNTRFLANSNAVREDNKRWAFIPERKILTVYNGIDTDVASLLTSAQLNGLRSGLNLPADAPLVGIVGRLSPEKDHATFLGAALQVARMRPDTRFLIIGDGPQHRFIESEIKNLGLSGKVLMLGERRDTQGLIQLLDVLVLTSSSEGFPNVLLEASLAGTSVVTTAAGGAAEVVLDGETGFVVPCGDSEAVARRVLDLLAIPLLKERFTNAARDRMQKYFSSDQAAATIQACYAQGKP